MISFRHLDHTKALDTRIKAKTQKLLRHLSPKAIVKWTCTTDKNVHRSEVKIHDGIHDYYVRAENSNLYKTFDDAIKKLKQQFTHNHTRRYATIRYND